MMSDELFLKTVESGEYALAEFDHRAHVRLAWICLKSRPLPEAMIRFRDTLKGFAARHGKGGIYHETMTFMFLLLIHERIHADPREAQTWERFEQANPRLITQGKALLLSLYTEDQLARAEAKENFRLPGPWTGATSG